MCVQNCNFHHTSRNIIVQSLHGLSHVYVLENGFLIQRKRTVFKRAFIFTRLLLSLYDQKYNQPDFTWTESFICAGRWLSNSMKKNCFQSVVYTLPCLLFMFCLHFYIFVHCIFYSSSRLNEAGAFI